MIITNIIVRSLSMANLHLFILYINILLAFFTAQSAATLRMSTDKEALLSVKSHLTLQSPNPLSSWEANSSPCNWTGVSCNKYGQRVVGLDLSGLRLSGSISPYIGNLSFLRSLKLQNNQFSGVLPDQVGNLFRLRVLNMTSNIIHGVIPTNISQCRELRALFLAQNQISGKIPEEISHLTKLRVLNLGGNVLSGAIPSSISNISSLQALSLGTNMLDGTIPTALVRLQLRRLDLITNNLTGTVPASIYNMSSLEFLGLAANNLWGNIPYDMGVTLPNLRGVKLCVNKFTGVIPGSLHNLTKIRIIRVATNFLHGTVPPGLGNLPELEQYEIAHNNIVSSGKDGLSFLESLTNSSRLNFLGVESNHLEGIIPDSIGNLSRNLKYLKMSRNRIFGSIPSSIGNLKSLQYLDLSNNSISGEIPKEIGQLKEIQMLGFTGNRFYGKIPNSLGNLQKANKIGLAENELVGSIPTTFGNLRNLLSIDLSNNKINGSIPAEFLNLPNLSILLDLSCNYLSGPLPQEVGYLQSVVTINMSHNRLSGEIPKRIGDCESLEHLSFAKNMFCGQIPDTLGAVRGLETLDLSSNQLSGEIPASLQKLEALQLLNLSFNNLKGEVPATGVFADPLKVHLEGNPSLCLHGAPNSSHPHKRRFLFVAIPIAIAIFLSIILGVGLLFYTRNRKRGIQETVETFKHEYQMVTYDQLRLATDNFSSQNLIAKGSFGSVYLAILGGVTVAVKVLDAEMTKAWKSFSAECATFKNAKHRNLIKLITTCSSIDFKNSDFLALVYEFMSNGNLEDWLREKRTSNGKGLNVLQRLNVAIDVACALDYLHHGCEIPIVHCDLKPGNVLLDSDMIAKVGDFGLARFLINLQGDETSRSSTHALKGSIGYIPPEYGLGEKPSTSGDVYSFGILLLELFTGKSPTHEDFVEELSLKNWVQMAFPSNLEQVLDHKLFVDESAVVCHDEQCVNADTLHDCLVNIISVGLSCVADSPDGRICITKALCLLKTIRVALLMPKLKTGPKC